VTTPQASGAKPSPQGAVRSASPQYADGAALAVDTEPSLTAFLGAAHTVFDLTAEAFADTTLIGTLTDQTGGGHHATESTNKPVAATVSGMPVARFDGVNDLLTTAAFTSLAQANTIVALAKGTGFGASGQFLVDGIVTGSRHAIYTLPTGTFWRGFAGTEQSAGTHDEDWHIWAVVFNGASSTYHIDGGGTKFAGDMGAHALTGLTVGNRFATSGASFWPGDINFIGVYDGDLLAADADLLNGICDELATRAGITWTTVLNKSDSYASGPTHGEGAAFYEAVQLSTGIVIMGAGSCDYLGLFDPSDDSYTRGPSPSTTNNAHLGITLVEDESIAILTPYASSTVGRYTVATNSYAAGAAHGEGANAFIGDATLLADGTMVFCPISADYIGLYNPSTDVYTRGDGHPETAASAFRGKAALLADGTMVLAPDWSDYVGLYNPSTDTYSRGAAHGEGNTAFDGAHLLADGTVVFMPLDSAYVGLYNPGTDTYTRGDAVTASGVPYQGEASLLADGTLVFPSSADANVGLYDPVADSATDGAAHGEGATAFAGSLLMADGRVLLIPSASSDVGLYTP